ncbi:MAG: 3'-5' exonuclease [Flavobacterium sp.]|nr:3'-5' exonuclease [Flavobacterium sp.]
MFDWIKNIGGNYPEFYKNYLSKFDKKSTRFVVLSIETTGLNKKEDQILSIGATAIVNSNIIVNDSFEISFYKNTKINVDNLKEVEYLQKLSESVVPNAIESFLDYLENAVLVGHRIEFDVAIINEYLENLKCGKLKNEALDVEVMYKKLEEITDKQFSLDDLLNKFKVEKSERYSASEDAFSIALLFLKLKSRLGIT